ncbi:hypothetical protein OCK74_25205 [Chitinophagaceae bacterium LB-8]|uniref:Uncharacterized protein n=1 Tax=Paraflavisolibacter caeni TaxID=2982496 RepID=A0A9X3BJ71_9BACT|nr:hypothetical protein [Paraflavisolibacter caeni]MCU7552442.1 hypothetical protein [Paraflavisolibacter caeni]
MQLSKEIAGVIPQNCDIQILQLKDYYFLFTHVPKSGKYQFWKVDASGNATNMLPLFIGLKVNFKDTNAVVQMNTDNKHVFLMTQVYYESLGRFQIERIKADSMLHFISSKRFVFEFNPEYESLIQMIPADEQHLLLLKRSKNENSENILELMKCDMQYGKMEGTQFSISHNLFAQPSMHFNAADSSIFIYSTVREPLLSSKVQRSLFMCKLNYSLEPMVPATLLKSRGLCSFILVRNLKLNWIYLLDYRLGFIAQGTVKKYKALQV